MIPLVSSVLAALHCKSSQAGVLCLLSSPSGLFDVIKLCIISVLGINKLVSMIKDDHPTCFFYIKAAK